MLHIKSKSKPFPNCEVLFAKCSLFLALGCKCIDCVYDDIVGVNIGL